MLTVSAWAGAMLANARVQARNANRGAEKFIRNTSWPAENSAPAGPDQTQLSRKMVNEFQTPRGAGTIFRFRAPDREQRILNYESFQPGLRGFRRNL